MASEAQTPELQAKLAQLGDYVAELQRWLNRPGDAEWALAQHRILERLVQLVVDCAADAGDLWLGAHGHPLGESAAGVFQQLHQVGLLDRETAARFRRYVSVR